MHVVHLRMGGEEMQVIVVVVVVGNELLHLDLCHRPMRNSLIIIIIAVEVVIIIIIVNSLNIHRVIHN